MLGNLAGVALGVGVIAGLYSLTRLTLRDIQDFKSKPRLKIEFDHESPAYLGHAHFLDSNWKRKFACLAVSNVGSKLAHRCTAMAKIIEAPGNEICLGLEFPLHWADLDWGLHGNGDIAVDVGPEKYRLDVAFTLKELSQKGCWLAAPVALRAPGHVNQAYLPPGNYKLEIKVSCNNGKGARKVFHLVSPESWEKLDMEQAA